MGKACYLHFLGMIPKWAKERNLVIYVRACDLWPVAAGNQDENRRCSLLGTSPVRRTRPQVRGAIFGMQRALFYELFTYRLNSSIGGCSIKIGNLARGPVVACFESCLVSELRQKIEMNIRLES